MRSGGQIRGPFLLAALALLAAAFVLFGTSPWSGPSTFTGLNAALWLAGIALLVIALRDRGGHIAFHPARRVDIAWVTALLAVSALSVVLRTHDLEGIPAEPISDHAEKLLDVLALTHGEFRIFFERNTGREPLQMYLTALIATLPGMGMGFTSLKLGTVLAGLLTLPYVYLLGRELGGRRVALLALLLAGIAYWPNVISRFGLRYPLYPMFAAPVLYHLVRGLRTGNRNDFVLCGLFLGIGQLGYTAFRIMPAVVAIGVGLYLVHPQARGQRVHVVAMAGVTALVALAAALPLVRYGLEQPAMFLYRTLSRIATTERELPGPLGTLVLENLRDAMLMFNLDNGSIRAHSIPHRPALDVVTATLFVAGLVLLAMRWVRARDWRDLFVLLCVPLLVLPSALSLAFPGENPSLNRAGGALVVVFPVAALAADMLLRTLRGSSAPRRTLAATVGVVLMAGALWQNHDLVFRQYGPLYRAEAMNTTQVARVVAQFLAGTRPPDHACLMPYPHWLDTRLVGFAAGHPGHDFACPPDLWTRSKRTAPSLFILSAADAGNLNRLQQVYPGGAIRRLDSDPPGRPFVVFEARGPRR